MLVKHDTPASPWAKAILACAGSCGGSCILCRGRREVMRDRGADVWWGGPHHWGRTASCWRPRALPHGYPTASLYPGEEWLQGPTSDAGSYTLHLFLSDPAVSVVSPVFMLLRLVGKRAVKTFDLCCMVMTCCVFKQVTPGCAHWPGHVDCCTLSRQANALKSATCCL